MNNEETNENNKTGTETNPTDTLFDKTNAATDRLEKANEKKEELLNREEELYAKQKLGGQSTAGEQQAPVKTEDEISRDNAKEMFKDTQLERDIEKAYG